jgi:protein-disulfide isomerase
MRTSPSEAVLVAPVDEQRDHIQGSADAPVTVVQYGDYECPLCGEAYPIIKQIQGRMGDRLRFVFRNFPIPTSHPHAQQAAEAAEAAGAQGKFWEMSGVRSGVKGTPTFYINGVRHDDSYELDVLLDAVERAAADR